MADAEIAENNTSNIGFEKMGRLTAEFPELFAESHELKNEIRKRQGAIGYELSADKTDRG